MLDRQFQLSPQEDKASGTQLPGAIATDMGLMVLYVINVAKETARKPVNR